MATPSPFCTTGPYFPVEWVDEAADLTRVGGGRARGQHIILSGTVVEAGAKPTQNTILEFWQPDAAGIFRHPLDPDMEEADPAFAGWGRARTLADGTYRLRTVLPGSYVEENAARIGHINILVLAIGLTRRLETTVYFEDGPDPVLNHVPFPRRRRLIARRDAALDEDGALGYRFDIVLQGEGETPFWAE
jgi:protocatechuate 3,4-dioxygenase, beta subunit